MKTSTDIGAYRIEQVDLATVSDELMRQAVELTWALEREAIPEDPDRPYETIAQGFRMTSPLFERKNWGAFAGGRLVGGVTLARNFTGSNEHLRDMSVNVLPEHRRRGLGRTLFRHALEAIGDSDATGKSNGDATGKSDDEPTGKGGGDATGKGNGREILIGTWTNSRVPAGGAFAERVGAKPGMRVRTSQLDLAALDRALMGDWSKIDPPGYRLEWFGNETPEPLMANVIAAFDAMNTMPREALQWDDWKTTPEIVREHERLNRDRGRERRVVLAIENATGETAAFTDIFFDPLTSHLIQQGGTAVIPAHRGKGIGKWVKARMILRAVEERPQARYIRTGNAGSNAPMLHINHAMGYRDAWENTVWQVPLADARKYVAR